MEDLYSTTVKRLTLNDYAWDEVARTQRFITDLFSGPAPDRPGAIIHAPVPGPDVLPAAPAGLNAFEREVWNATEQIKRRPLGNDDFVPTLSTNAGTCAMATAFGCEERRESGYNWVRPCITDPAQIDTLRKPEVSAGRLGEVLARTRAYAACADERLPIRVMDFQSPFTTVEQMLGSDAFFLMPYDHPERLKALMNLVTDFAIDFFQAQVAAAGPNCCPGVWPPFWFPKCAGIQMSDDNLVNVSPAVYAEFVVPYNSRIASAFDGMFLHSCTITEPAVAVVAQIAGLTGVNCDISTSVTTARLLDAFGTDRLVGPHAYINTDTNFSSYTAFMRAVLAGWQPGKRLFVYPCVVLYQPDTSTDLQFNAAHVESVLNEIPAWRRDHSGV